MGVYHTNPTSHPFAQGGQSSASFLFKARNASIIAWDIPRQTGVPEIPSPGHERKGTDTERRTERSAHSDEPDILALLPYKNLPGTGTGGKQKQVPATNSCSSVRANPTIGTAWKPVASFARNRSSETMATMYLEVRDILSFDNSSRGRIVTCMFFLTYSDSDETAQQDIFVRARHAHSRGVTIPNAS
ncbi:hypothetical protein LIA77_04841 [Sarocladium implicatum]|nr:hypothetical protein LIA77_04841 [Sarocladium implicatum]